MLLKDIKVYPCFWETPPNSDKMARKMQYLMENGTFQSDVIVNSENYLIDGFTSYLLAREYGLAEMPVRHGERQIIKACHKPGGRLYSWELPPHLGDQVFVGDQVYACTQWGVRRVTVAAIEEWSPQESPGPLRNVIRKKAMGDGKGVIETSIKITLSYERSEELKAVLERLGPMAKSYKVAKRQRGRFKKAYILGDELEPEKPEKN